MDKMEPPKIVDLPHRGPGKQLPKKFVNLLTSCRQQTQDFVDPLFDGLFALVDDNLFDCADKAHTNQEQSLYFDAMRLLRLERQAIERRLHQAIAERFNQFIEQKPEKDQPLEQLDPSDLSLIQREEYEQVVTITNLAAHAEGRCNEILWALEQRLAVLNQGVKLNHHNNPAAPRALVHCYTQSLEPLKLADEVAQVLHQLFQVEVLNNIEPLYNQLNQYLIDSKILPNLKYSTQANRSIERTGERLSHAERPEPAAPNQGEAPSSSGWPGAGQTSGATPAMASMFDGASANSPQQPDIPGFSSTLASHGPSQNAQEAAESMGLLRSITQLLGQRLHLSLPGEMPFPSILNFSTAPADSSVYSQQELMQAINLLQAQQSEQQLVAPVPVIQIKQELVEQLEESSETPLAVAEPDAEIIDLVGMLFDFILDDDELPDQTKALLSHLHTPYLKIALADRKLFEAHDHPARQLLNLMARAACEWSDNAHNSQSIRERIEKLVERILQEYDEGTTLFEELFDEFQRFYQLLERQTSIVEQRAVEAAQGRDKLVSARLLADREISQALSEQPLPDTLVQFLRGPWTDVLVFSHLRHGAQSPIWRQALDTLDQLCWSVTPKTDEDERAQLRRVQPELIHSLTELLSQLGGLQVAQIRAQLTPLVELQKAALGLTSAAAADADQESSETPVPAPAPSLGHETLDEEVLAVDEGALDQIPDKISKQLAALDFGCWFRFQEGDTTRRLKLAWYSPTTYNYMFVDSAGHRAAVRSKLELADELADGRAQIIQKEGMPLMDRALQAIHSLLLKFTSGDKQ